ncbi:MAG TPA: hypothetical protein VGF98_14675 [Candidatus Tumulicola sp.]|jgi:hypothetical protein
MISDFVAKFFFFGDALSMLERTLWYGFNADKAGIPEVGFMIAQGSQNRLIPDIETECQKLGLSMTLHAIGELRRTLNPAGTPNPAAVLSRLETLKFTAANELKQHYFLYVSSSNASHFVTPLNGWTDVVARFPTMIEDIEEAEKCNSLARSTAAVFHLMRMMEIGVQAFGNALGLVGTPHKTWGAISNEIGRSNR